MFIVLSSSLNRWDVFVLRKRLAACLAGVLRHSPFLGKDIPILSFLFLCGGGGGVDGGLQWDRLFGVHLTRKFH